MLEGREVLTLELVIKKMNRDIIAVPRSPRYESLDLWRGVACLMVVIYHSDYYLAESTGTNQWPAVSAILARFWIGVPMFFVISGYCISAAADSERSRLRGTMSYFKRRFRRIFPPLLDGLFPANGCCGHRRTVSSGAVCRRSPFNTSSVGS